MKLRDMNRNFIIFSVTIFIASLSYGAIINVPADQATIQDGIDAAQNSDTVLVDHGRYIENIHYRGKDIVVASNYLFSKDPSDLIATIIDGSNPTLSDSGSVVRIVSNQDTTTTLLGFIITGGSGTVWARPDFGGDKYREGGGIFVNNASPTIKYNIIVNNESLDVPVGVNDAGGGGIRCRFGSPQILNNIVQNNRGSFGGGIHLLNVSAIVRNNVVAFNDGGSKFGGGGILVGFTGGTTIIENNTIVNNTTGINTGGLQSFFGGVAIVRNNIIRNNIGGNIGFVSSPTTNISMTYSNVGGGFTGTGNFDQNPFFAENNYYLSDSSTSIDAGDPAITFNDVENTSNLGMALIPSHGTLRNDVGAYGGPHANGNIPTFTIPMLEFLDSLIELNNLPLMQDTTLSLEINNSGFAQGIVDSIIHTSGNSSLLIDTPLPWTSNILFTDSVNIIWTAITNINFQDSLFIFHNDTSTINPHTLVIAYTPTTCCLGVTGNVDGSVGESPDIGDLTALIDFLFISLTEPACLDEANTDGVGGIDIGDLTALIDFLFINLTPTADCP